MATDVELLSMAGGSNSTGRGGMITKVTAARLAARSGACTIIANGREPDVLIRLAAGDDIGTLLLPEKQPVAARKQWLAGQLKARGQLVIDEGAVKVLQSSGRSLLPVGVIAVHGEFERGDVVTLLNQQGREIARGLVNYDSVEAAKLLRCSSDRIAELLGYAGEQEIMHRDNMVMTD
jgi:glutamate 5-kinase